MFIPKTAALILIDVQKGFDSPFWGPRNNPSAEENMEKLLRIFRSSGRVVIHVQHMSRSKESPLFPGQEGNEFKPFARPLPDEKVFQKDVNSSFIGTGLEAYLRENKIQTLVLAGISTNHCVSTTARMAGNLDFTTYVAGDATHAFDFTGVDGQHFPAQLMYEVGLAEIHREFAMVIKTEELILALNKTPRHNIF